MQDNKIRVLMCGSDITNTKGGIVAVIQNYLDPFIWENVKIHYVATHMDGTNIQKAKIFHNALKKIERLLKAGEVDVAHLHMSERGSIYRKIKIAGMCHKYGVPVIIHHHGAEFFESVYSMNDKDKRELFRALESVEMNLVLSKKFLKDLKKIVPGAHVTVLHNAVRILALPRDREKNYITMMGRIGQRKGTFDLLKAIKNLDDELDPSIRFCLCGDGETEKVRSYIETEAPYLSNRIAHLGWVEGEKKLEILSKTFVHVLPSYNEALPMSILETMGMGIPNIATDIDGISEVIKTGENGILIDVGDIRQLEKTIREMATDPELCRMLGQNALETVEEEYTLDKHIQKLSEIYMQITENQKSSTGNHVFEKPVSALKEDISEKQHEEDQNRNIFRDMPKHRKRNVIIAVGLLLAVLGSLIGGNIIQNRNFGTTFYRVSSPKISDEVRIVLLTDLHNHEYGAGNARLVEKVENLNPDIIAMAGDMVVKDDPDTSVVIDLCTQLLEIAPIYYSMGNHEGEIIYNYNIPLDTELKNLGVTVFYNDSVDVNVNGNAIRIGGVGTSPEDFEEYSEEFVKEFEETDDFKLLLAHYPSLFYDYLSDADIDLSLAGHFHGGQIQLPGIGGLLAIPLDWFPKYCDGQFTLEENGTLIVSRGLGNSRIIPRINNQPELVVVDLRQY